MPSNPTRLLGFEIPTGNNSAGPITTSSVTPAANALVVVYVFGNAGALSSVTSEFATVDGWTVGPRTNQSNCTLTAAWAVTTGSPGSGTISCSSGADFNQTVVLVEQVASGFNATTPIAASISGVDGQVSDADVLTPTGTFSAAPAANSLLLGAIHVRPTTGSAGGSFSIAPESGMTAVGANHDEWQNKKATAYAPGSHGSTMGWVVDTGTDRSSIIGLEVLAAAASGPTITAGEVFDETETSLRLRCTVDTDEGSVVFAIYPDGEGPDPATPGNDALIYAEGDTLDEALAAQKVAVSEVGVVSSSAFTGLAPGTDYDYRIVHGVDED